MKTDPRCMCLSCFIRKTEDVINNPPIDRTKLETVRMSYLNKVQYEKSTNHEFIEKDYKIFELIEKIDCYADVEDIMFSIDMIKLYFDAGVKEYSKKSSFLMTTSGFQFPKNKDRTNRIYQKLDNNKTIFDVKEIY